MMVGWKLHRETESAADPDRRRRISSQAAAFDGVVDRSPHREALIALAQ